MNKIEAAILDLDLISRGVIMNTKCITLSPVARTALYQSMVATNVITPFALGCLAIERNRVMYSMGCLDSGL